VSQVDCKPRRDRVHATKNLKLAGVNQYKRFKDWGALWQIWRHDIPHHGETFRVICKVSQQTINDGEKLFLSVGAMIHPIRMNPDGKEVKPDL
jgi:hypothetical protein